MAEMAWNFHGMFASLEPAALPVTTSITLHGS